MKTFIQYKLPILVIGSLLLISCSKEPVSESQAIRPVKVQSIEGAAESTVRNLPGTIGPAQSAEMAFQGPGRITEFLVSEGQQVVAGTVLARIDPRDYQATFDQAEAAYNLTITELERSERIFRQDSGAISTSSIESNRERAQVAEAAYRQAEKALEDTVLRAPFDGIVARKFVDDYETVQAQRPVLTFQDLSTLEIEVAVPEREIARYGELMTPEEATELIRPRVRITSIVDREFVARVTEFATAADTTTRSFRVRMQFDPPPDLAILPGMTARVFYTDLNSSAILIPSHAAFSDTQGNANVWILDSSSMTVGSRRVQLGNFTGDQVEVISGLSQDDQVAITGVNQLREGMKVTRLDF
jgi:multidrug efflux system membrane fusion protein